MAATGTPGKAYSLPGFTFSYGAPFVPGTFALGGRGRVFFVGNASGLPSGNGQNPDYPFATIEQAILKCVSGRGDIIYVLPNHAQNISSATAWPSLVSGINIIGIGFGLNRPTFTFSTATASLPVGAAISGVMIRNCRFLAAGPQAGNVALTVAAPFAVAGPGFSFVENEVQMGVDADQLCTNCVALAATATDATFYGNYMWGSVGSVITTAIKTTGAVDRLKIINNTISAEVVTAATGVLLDLSNAAIVDNLIMGNCLANNTASSKFVIKPHASSTGYVDNNTYFGGDGTTAPAVSGWSTYTTNYKFGKGNASVTAVSVSALLSPVVDA